MASYVAGALVVLVLSIIFNVYRGLTKNLAMAKASGIPYVVTPWYHLNRPMAITSSIWEPLLRRLPERWTSPWLDMLVVETHWRSLYAIYRQCGNDTLLMVSPGQIGLLTADADVIHQVTNRRNDFPKPIEMYGLLDIYGKNVITTEGVNWRRHRRITSPPFTEKNNHLVFTESIHQAQSMLESFLGKGSVEACTVEDIAESTRNLTLAVISRAALGVRMEWPTVDGKGARQGAKPASGEISGSTAFNESLKVLTDHILWLILVPRFLLGRLPFKGPKLAQKSYIEWGNQMRQIIAKKKAGLESGTSSNVEDADLLASLIRSSRDESIQEKGQAAKGGLIDEEILGNAFVFIVAGHETSANSLFFCLVYLALYTKTQRKLQAELDTVFSGRPPSEWDYDQDLPPLFGGLTGAILAEQLRLIPPVPSIPKCTITAQPLQVNGKACTVPAKTQLNLVTPAVHRNPKYWPMGGPVPDFDDLEYPLSNPDDDLGEFRPERWLLAEGSALSNGRGNGAASLAKMPVEATDKPAAAEQLGINTAADTAATLFQPPRGAFIPFSDGFRSCLGRRFAQVEILAVLAVVFQTYSVELAVDAWATDAEVEAMSKEQRSEVWEKARKEARRKMRENVGAILTLQMRGTSVPLRIVKRGGERFEGR